MRLALPEELTIDNLREHDIVEYAVRHVLASDIEFLSKTTVRVLDQEFFIDPEGLKELGGFVGISKQYLNKLPDDLFAYTMNYFYRRAEDTSIELLTDSDTVLGIQLEDTIRLSLKDILDIIVEAYEGTPLFTELDRKNGDYVITIVKDKKDNGGDIYYDAVTMHLNDRLWANPSYHMSAYRWGPTIRVNKYLESSLAKNTTLQKAVEQIKEDLAFTLENVSDVVGHAIDIASKTTLDDPHTMVSKVFAEHGLKKYADDILGMTTISDSPTDCFSAAKSISNLAFNDKLTARQKKKSEEIAGNVLTKLPTDHRCSLCLSYVED